MDNTVYCVLLLVAIAEGLLWTKPAEQEPLSCVVISVDGRGVARGCTKAGSGYSLRLESHRVILLFCLLHCDLVGFPHLDSEVSPLLT